MKNRNFPKTVKGYVSRLKSLDDYVTDLKGYNKLTYKEKESLGEVRAYIADVIDTFKNR